MKNIAFGLAVLLASVSASGQQPLPGGPVAQMQQKTSARQPLNVGIKVPTTLAANGIVAGTTNLPDGTVLSLSLAGPDGSAFNRDNCCFNAVVAVSHGAFGPVKIIKDGVTPDPGNYRVIVVMRDWTMQPPSVVAAIGNQGENLRGRFVIGESDDRGVEATLPVEVQ